MTPEDIRVRNRLSNLRGQMTRRIIILDARGQGYAEQGRIEAALAVGERKQGVIDARLMVDRMIARLEGRK